MKNVIFKRISFVRIAILTVLVLLLLTSCFGGDCEHYDYDYDGYCDECGEEYGEPGVYNDDYVTLTIHNVSDDPNETWQFEIWKYQGNDIGDYSRTGYKFLGLYDQADGGVMMVDEYGITVYGFTNDTTLYARWEKLIYTHSFEVNELGFLADAEPITVSVGDTVTILPVPEVVDGYEFVGWYSEQHQTFVSNGEEVVAQYQTVNNEAPVWFSNEAFKAVIERKTYQVTLNYNNDVQADEFILFNEGEKVEGLPMLNSDYDNCIEFFGWSTDPYTFIDYTTDESLNAIHEDVTLFAFFVKYREITFVSGDTSRIIRVYENIPFELPDSGVPGMKVDAWFTSELFNTVPVSNITYYTPYDVYYAQLSIATYTVTYQTEDGDVIPSDTYTINDELVLPTLEKEHYTFLGWCRHEDLSDRPITTLSIGNYGDVTLYAKFRGDEKTVVFEDGNGSLNQKNMKLEYGANYSLPIPNYPGYAFMGWYLDEDFTAKLTDENGDSINKWTIIDESTTVYAKYEKKYFVSISTTSHGAASYEIKPYYLKGEKVEINITVTDGYFYDGIFIEDRLVSNSKKYTFIMGEENVALTLKFHRVGNITLKLSDPSFAQYVSCVTKAKEGDTVYINYKEFDYGIFKISVNGAEVELNDDYSFVMPGGDAEVSIEFGPKRYTKIDTGDTGITLYQYNGHFYAIVNTSVSFTNAKAYCENFGGHLVYIESEAEKLFIEDLRQKTGLTAQGIWIGASDEGHEGEWKWLNGKSLQYSCWYSGEPNNGNGYEHYAHIRYEDGLWNDASEPNGMIFICEWEKAADMKFPTVQSLRTPEGEEVTLSIYQYNNHYYSIVKTPLVWTQAERFCEYIGGRLLALETEDEAIFIDALRFYTGTKNQNILIGASDEVSEGDWRWPNGTKVTYSAWAGGQPDNAGGIEDYVHLYGSGDTKLWNDVNNSQAYYFICEWESFANIGNTIYGNYFNMIYTAEDFVKYIRDAEITAGRDFVLMADVDLSGIEWTPKDFNGNFNGGGNTVSNLTVTSASGNVGVFLNVTGKITNLYFEGLTVNSTCLDHVLAGGVCTNLSGTLENVHVRSGVISSVAGTTGGIAATMSAGARIVECTNGAHVSSGVTAGVHTGTGGIVGYAITGLISNCQNNGAVNGGSFTGGILGSSGIGTGIVLENLKNLGNVAGAGEYTGGITGYYSKPFTYNLENMSNEGNVSGIRYVGGIFGQLVNDNSDANRSVYTMTLVNFKNSGAVSGVGTETGDYVGGLIGYLYANDYGYHSYTSYDGAITVIIKESANTGNVSGRFYVGGMFGYASTDSDSSIVYSAKSSSEIKGYAYLGAIGGHITYLHLDSPSNEGSSFRLEGAYVDGSSKWAYIGGYVGCAVASNITSAINNVPIIYNSTQCTGARVGGICGSSSGTFSFCENHAVILAPNSDDVGGIAGNSEKTFTYISQGLTNTADITGVNQVGGIFGRVYNNNSDAVTATYSLTLNTLSNSGRIVGTGNNVAGLIGYLYTDDYGYHSYNGYDGRVILYLDNGKNTGDVKGQYYVGGIFGYARTDAYESVVTNLSSSANIEAVAIVGGIAGQTSIVNFENPTNAGSTVKATGTYTDGSLKRAWIGGYFGIASESNITGAVNNVEINYSSPLSLGAFVGGIAGEAWGNFNSCENHAKIYAPKSECVGGIAGYTHKTFTFTSENLTNTAEITGTNYVGGIFGQMINNNSDAVTATYTMTLNAYKNSGNVTASGSYAAGIIAYLYTDDYGYHSYNGYDGQVIVYMNYPENTGNVTGEYYVGGIFGYARTDAYDSNVIGAKSSAHLTANAIIGGIAGYEETLHLEIPSNEGSAITALGTYLNTDNTKRAWIGGYIGYSNNSNVTGAINNVAIDYSSPLNMGVEIGGICGVSSGIVKDCQNNARIYAPGVERVGGICGIQCKAYSYDIINLANTGDITGTDQVGGIFGRLVNENSDANSSTYTMQLKKLTNSGNVTGGSDGTGYYVGGICGYLYTNDYGYHSYSSYDGRIIVYVSECVSTSCTVTGVGYVGGMFGYARTDTGDSMLFACTVSEVTLNATENFGELCGFTENFNLN